MVEWCECQDYLGGGFGALSALPLNIYVHSCGSPTFEVWRKYEKYCEECGRSFSNPWVGLCSRCWHFRLSDGPLGAVYPSWDEALQRTRDLPGKRFFQVKTSLTKCI